MNCAICGKPCVSQGGSEEDYVFQDTGEPVHAQCRGGTFWHVGERVITRFWEPGMPVGTVKDARVVYGKFRPNAFANLEERAVEWVTVEFDDGEVKDYAAWDVKRAPQEAI